MLTFYMFFFRLYKWTVEDVDCQPLLFLLDIFLMDDKLAGPQEEVASPYIDDLF